MTPTALSEIYLWIIKSHQTDIIFGSVTTIVTSTKHSLSIQENIVLYLSAYELFQSPPNNTYGG